MNERDLNIIIFTRWFPYNKEKEYTFLQSELDHLKNNFNKVYIVPQKIEGTYHKLSDDFIIDTSLAEKLKKSNFKNKIKTLLSLTFYKELLIISLNTNKAKYTLSHLLSAYIVQEWIYNFFKKNKFESKTILYSFWMDFSSLGFVLAKKKLNFFKTISRCHNFDLYGNADNYFYVPYQKYMVNNLEEIYPDSHFGIQYLNKKYSNVNCKLGIMGISDVGFLNQPSNDGVFRIVSCSYMIPRKRVLLFLDGLLNYCRLNMNRKLEWYHIGEGPEFEKVKNKAKQSSDNCSINLLGNLSYDQLMDFYKNTSIDLFVNTSTKEGTPVSLMEAICCSIPVLVTGFGGNKEIANAGAGFLLPENPLPEEICEKINEIINCNHLDKYRVKSREVWKTKYNSTLNYEIFCKELKKY